MGAMTMLTWLPEVLRAEGLVVVEYDGWQTRTTRSGGLEPEAVVCHHTATSASTSNTAVARLLANGRSDLKGPLAQLGLDRDGHYWMIAAGRCNHNGYGEHGNDAIGIEAFNDGVGEPWPEVQVDAFARGCAAILRHLGLGASRCLGHKETDPTRKIDPTFDMRAFRARVTNILEGDMSEATDLLHAVLERLARIEDVVRKIDSDIDDNLPAQLAELRRNLRRDLEADGVPEDEIER